jgi:hypothetical protein
MIGIVNLPYTVDNIQISGKRWLSSIGEEMKVGSKLLGFLAFYLSTALPKSC